MATVNLGQVAALIQSVSVEPLASNATPTVKNVGTKANAEFVFGIPKVELTDEIAACTVKITAYTATSINSVKYDGVPSFSVTD